MTKKDIKKILAEVPCPHCGGSIVISKNVRVLRQPEQGEYEEKYMAEKGTQSTLDQIGKTVPIFEDLPIPKKKKDKQAEEEQSQEEEVPAT